jgi:hypothetical protein
VSWTRLSAFGLAISCVIVLFGVIDVLRFAPEQWQRAGRSRGGWIVVQIVIGALGTVLYVATVRHDVRDPDRDLGFGEE